MDYTKETKSELLEIYYENPPETPTAIKALTELQRRRDEDHSKFNLLVTVFTGIVALSAMIEIVAILLPGLFSSR